MRTKHLFATLVVAVVAAASLGVAVALNAPEVADRTTASIRGDAGPGTGARAGGDPAGRNGGRPAGTASGQTTAEGTGGTGHHDQQRQLSQADLVAKIKPSVVHLAGLSGSGSGVVVDGDRGLVLTNAHVTAGQQGKERVEGLYVWYTEPGSSAEAGNLGKGDLVTRIDGRLVSTVQEVCDLVLPKRPGETVRVDGLHLNSTADPAQVGTSWETEVKVG